MVGLRNTHNGQVRDNMKIKIYVLTYNNPTHLDQTLRSLYNTADPSRYGLYIINNHSNFNLASELEPHVDHVFHNELRLDRSTGHPSRNWNQALMNGFVDLQNPEADLVIHVQDDVVFHNAWLDRLIKAHEKFSFIMDGQGDTLCSYTPEAVRRIGLWEERYCSLGWGEFDYQIKSVIYNRDKTCINTDHPLGPWNQLRETFVARPPSNQEKQQDKIVGNIYHTHSRALFVERWGHAPEEKPLSWYANHVVTTNTPNYVLYPYFEKDVEGLYEEKNFVRPIH